MNKRHPPAEMVARWRANALHVLTSGHAYPPSTIRLAWRFLQQHGARP